jgi:putative flippase GtrA
MAMKIRQITLFLPAKLRPLLEQRPVRFILVGGLNTVIGYALFALLVATGLNYPYAMMLTTSIGVMVNFKSTGKLVFNNSNNRLLFKFIALYVFIYFFNIMLIRGLDFFFHNVYISGIFSIMAAAVVSYYGNKNFIFTANQSMLNSPPVGDQRNQEDLSQSPVEKRGTLSIFIWG